MLMKLLTGFWEDQPEMMNMSLVKDNVRTVVMAKGRSWKFWQFSRMNFRIKLFV